MTIRLKHRDGELDYARGNDLGYAPHRQLIISLELCCSVIVLVVLPDRLESRLDSS